MFKKIIFILTILISLYSTTFSQDVSYINPNNALLQNNTYLTMFFFGNIDFNYNLFLNLYTEKQILPTDGYGGSEEYLITIPQV